MKLLSWGSCNTLCLWNIHLASIKVDAHLSFYLYATVIVAAVTANDFFSFYFTKP